jgi:hypothetical protein
MANSEDDLREEVVEEKDVLLTRLLVEEGEWGRELRYDDLVKRSGTLS